MLFCVRTSLAPLLLVSALFLPALRAEAVTIDWVAVGNPGNAPDGTGYGAVSSSYRIGETEVTNAEYAEFLNAVASTDTYALYNASMASGSGGITQAGGAGSFSYAPIGGRADNPVNFVSFYDALRFANWMHNGQPAGAQGASTTEDGAYTITPDGILNNSIARNADATIFLAGEDEWYKAAYYDALGTSYFDYPAGSDLATACASPGGGANSANCGSAVGDVATVGAYTGSPSPYGTFDQGGNVREWTEAAVFDSRVARGGGFGAPAETLAAASRLEFLPDSEALDLGFRLASVPEPATGLLLAIGLFAGLRERRS